MDKKACLHPMAHKLLSQPHNEDNGISTYCHLLHSLRFPRGLYPNSTADSVVNGGAYVLLDMPYSSFLSYAKMKAGYRLIETSVMSNYLSSYRWYCHL